ncbi:HlyD family secretion protein [Aminirod propionatiphilus]|uniref:HlyD family efflux transporter periplasmic adaptor subunit n=1 Tax=Aminirod propionatiphilus TaxID=3415223 RepID=A0ACD1DWH2_9BACT|nr:HlyD family efflux transporter periplasmic adaptor subunit [Synergistota bacterium]
MKIRFNTPEGKAADVRAGVRVPYAPAKRAFPRWRWYLVVLLVTSPLLFFLSKVAIGWLMASSPGVVYMERLSVNSPRPAVIENLSFGRGDFVEAGKPLLRLSDASLELLRAPLEAERRALLLQSPQSNPVSAQRRALVLAQEVTDYEARRLGIIEELFRKGAATRAEVDEAAGRVQRARADQIRSGADLEEAQRIFVDPNVPVRLAQIEAELKSLTEGKGPLEVRSPISGQILELFVGPGEAVGQGTPLALIADPERVCLITFVAAKDMRFVEPGRDVRVRFPDGTLMAASVDGSPLLAEPTPLSLAGPLADAGPALKVRLLPGEPLKGAYRVEGLPVTVYWGQRRPWHGRLPEKEE